MAFWLTNYRRSPIYLRQFAGFKDVLSTTNTINRNWYVHTHFCEWRVCTFLVHMSLFNNDLHYTRGSFLFFVIKCQNIMFNAIFKYLITQCMLYF